MKYRMPFIFKLWKNSFPLHLKAIFYLVPVIILLYSILLNALLPVLSQYLFLKNSDYAQEIIFDSVSSEAFRQTENPYMFSFAEMAIITEVGFLPRSAWRFISAKRTATGRILILPMKIFSPIAGIWKMQRGFCLDTIAPLSWALRLGILLR